MYSIKVNDIVIEREDKVLLKDLAKELGIDAFDH